MRNTAQRRETLALFAARPGEDLTAEDLVYLLDLPISTVYGRLQRLADEGPLSRRLERTDQPGRPRILFRIAG